MGFWSSVGSFVSSACSAIGSAVSSIGSALASTASSFLKVASPYLGPIVNVVMALAQSLGILTEEDDMDELGAKAMESEKGPEDFNSTAEYIDHLKNEVKLDKEKFANATESEKLAHKAVGTSIAIKGIEEKKGFDIPNEAWLAMGKMGLGNLAGKEKEMDAILDNFRGSDAKDLNDYVDGKLTTQKELAVGDKLTGMYNLLEPNASPADIEARVVKAQAGV